MNDSTTILFVPGAWHSPECFNDVILRLHSANYKTDKVFLPSVNPTEEHSDFSADVAQIRKQIKRAVDQGQNVMIVAHSYGSLPSNDAIRGLDVMTCRHNGLKGGVTHFFFCCSFIIPEGESLISAFGNKDPPWFMVSDDRLVVTPENPGKIFYNDCEATQVEQYSAALRPHSYQTFHTPCTYSAWKDLPSTYLYCLQDAAIPLSMQKKMVEKTARGYSIATDTIDASHSPFLSRPDEMATSIRRAAGENF